MAYRALSWSREKFRRLYLDPSVSIEDMMAEFGCSASTISCRRRMLGLVPRSPRPPCLIDGVVLRRLWAFGVSVDEMAAHFGVSVHAIKHARKRHSLPPRHPSGQYVRTVAEWRQDQLREAMASAARVEQTAMRRADMVDRLMSDDGLAAIVAARRAREARKAVAA